MSRSDDSSRHGAAAAVVPLSAASATNPIVGWLVSFSPEEGPRVDWIGNTNGPVLARSTVLLEPSVSTAAIEARQGVVLLFEQGRQDLPIVIGLLAEGPALEAQLPRGLPEARVDGKRMTIEAADEIVLKCGAASIVLRRNGRIVVRGTYVETRAAGVNRIKGGSVLIN